jgi:cytochrome P450/nitrite reductase/ring-hydroxylating ferredoxin subunit
MAERRAGRRDARTATGERDPGWERVAASGAWADGRPHGVSSSGGEIVLLRTHTGIHAYEGRCPHQGALLAEGQLENGVLVCRNHGWRFDAETGRRLGGAERLRRCPVQEEEGSIWARGPEDEPAAAPGPPSAALRRLRDLPGPRGLPLLGNLLQIDLQSFHTRLEGWAAVHGHIYQLRLGPRRALVVSEREAADHALRARPETFRRIHTFEAVAAELGMVGVFTAEGEAWRPLRRLAMEALSNRRLPGFYPVLRTVAERARRRWERIASSGEAVDMVEEFRRFAVDVTTWLALGRDVNTLEGKSDVIERHVGSIFPVFHRRVVATVPYWRLFRLPSDRRFDRALAAVRAWIHEVIAEARAGLDAQPNRAPSNFLEAMLSERDEAGRPFSGEALFGSAMTMLIAGQDTTSAALAWTVHHLCGSPEAQARLRAELDSVLEGAAVPDSVARAQRLSYAGAVVNESLRLSPVVPILYLEANRDTVMAGACVPRGTPVFLLTRPAVREGRFAAPDAFRPERWLNEERGPLVHDPKAHIPFGSGPRLCPGRALATLETRVALATLFGGFEVERVGGHAQERYNSLMVPAGLTVRLRRRPASASS